METSPRHARLPSLQAPDVRRDKRRKMGRRSDVMGHKEGTAGQTDCDPGGADIKTTDEANITIMRDNLHLMEFVEARHMPSAGNMR